MTLQTLLRIPLSASTHRDSGVDSSVLPDTFAFFERPFRGATGVHIVVRRHKTEDSGFSCRAVIGFEAAPFAFGFCCYARLFDFEFDSPGRTVRPGLFILTTERTRSN